MKKSIEITIPEPCHEDWSKMTLTQRGKHCATCQKEVIDFTQFTDEQIYKTARQSNHLCGRFTKSQLERPILLNRKTHTSWASYVATLALPIAMLATQDIKAQKHTESIEQTEGSYKRLGISSLSRSAQYDISRKQNKPQQTTRIIKGVISEENGPLPGASVYIKGTDKGTQTNFDGEYELEVSTGDTIIAAYVGYRTLEVIVTDQIRINFHLASECQLDDIIMAGNLIVKESDNAPSLLNPIKPRIHPGGYSKDRAKEVQKQKAHWRKVKVYKEYKREQKKVARNQNKKK